MSNIIQELNPTTTILSNVQKHMNEYRASVVFINTQKSLSVTSKPCKTFEDAEIARQIIVTSMIDEYNEKYGVS